MIKSGIIKQYAEGLGFDAIGIVPVALLSEARADLELWLSKSYNAGMSYMERNVEKRENPSLLVENAKSVVVTLTNYYNDRVYPDKVMKIARYAWGKDYHIVIKDRLFELLELMKQNDDSNIPPKDVKARCFVDSAPVFEHELAKMAGLGWIGKNTLLINKKLGSFTFISTIISSYEFDVYDNIISASYCGTCSRCVDACPTNAIVCYADSEGKNIYGVNAGRCIAYNTIESKDVYPDDLKLKAGDRIFGCDICQEVCPWNKKLVSHTLEDFMPDVSRIFLDSSAWMSMTQDEFDRNYKDSPLQRAGLEHIKRNIL